ncbi:sugar phosphate isomerase/epimerase family protein [Anianabacter salinae]|uniref:sugar phosphate isomerase/epimerase family protein n=1 Tax=Anianabacter salinae TaxID=2851023 RepID=UPI00225E0EFF|nr:TIM barrel protein [Anianabacter salinae]MBV0911058.1 TIM barrel protein [Anianabacter salinae]
MRDVAPVDLPGVARAVGIDTVSVFVTPPSPDLDIFPKVQHSDLASFRSACAENGVGVHNIEVFSIGPDTDVAAFARALDLGAEIGATRLTALVQDRDERRAADGLAALADAAAARGIAVSIEFMKFSECRSIGAGEALLREIGHDTLSLLVDPLHLFRTGGTIADLAACDPALIGAAQLCDGPLDAPKSAFAEAVHDRGIPGEGAFPLAAFIDALPADIPIDMEVPMKRLATAGVGTVERAQRLVDATRALIR